MQTFLPYPDFAKSASVLDRLRLGKQRIECLQILRTLSEGSPGWNSHPAIAMWKGHTSSLALYGLAVCAEWIKRGYKDTTSNNISFYYAADNPKPPPWFGDELFHASHRSNLLRKDKAWYGQWGWKEKDDMEYVWPKGEGA